MAEANDLQVLTAMFARAGINFRIDRGEGWSRRMVLEGDRCLVFDCEHNLAGIRSEDDNQSFDGD